ncbi:MAG TPA: uL15 family ribosomal protein [Candidatus Paceibacterota bacterium]
MQIHNIKKNKSNRKAKAVGRGGKRGKTSGKGTKGQNARSGKKRRPEMRDFIKKFPKLRGRGRNFLKSIQKANLVVGLSAIDSNFSDGESVTVASLSTKGILNSRSGKIPVVKIVAGGNLKKKLSFSGLKVSSTAKEAIEKAGGSIS